MPEIQIQALTDTLRSLFPRSANIEVSQDQFSNALRIRRITYHPDTGQRQYTEYAMPIEQLQYAREGALGHLLQNVVRQLSGHLEQQSDSLHADELERFESRWGPVEPQPPLAASSVPSRLKAKPPEKPGTLWDYLVAD